MRGGLYGLAKPATQSMNVPKKGASSVKLTLIAIISPTTTGAGSYVMPENGVVVAELRGPGGAGSGVQGSPGGGGGGAALLKTFSASKGDVINFNLGAPGVGVTDSAGGNATDTTLTYKTLALVAGGGKGGNGTVGQKGVATGGDVNVDGANGNQDCTGGGIKGVATIGGSGGGGGAGFGAIETTSPTLYAGGNGGAGAGSSAVVGSNPSGGGGSPLNSGGGSAGSNGGNGRITLLIFKQG